MTKVEKENHQIFTKEIFPLKVDKPYNWLRILTIPASEPQLNTQLTWQNLLSDGLAKVVQEITQSNHPFNHQTEAIKYLTKNHSQNTNRDLIINGGTYSGKSLSFMLPGIIKLLTGEIDFFVVFYPSKQLLLDQFDRMKELVVKLWKETDNQLTVRMYSGDITKKSTLNTKNLSRDSELFETEQRPPTILLATFDKVWYQLISGQHHPLLEKIKSCQYMVFDEIHAFEGFAAAIIKGFIQVHKIINPNCQVVLSSATIDNVTGFRDDFLPEAAINTCPPVRGEQEFCGTTKDHTIPLLAELWEGLESLPGKVCLVFLDSKEEIELLTERLCMKLSQEHSFFDSDTIAMIHADLPYIQRKKVLDEIRKEQQNRIRILLSSSVLELGVNVPNIQTVVNIGIPITQKDGIVQRMARNRSRPGERRVNIFLFDLTNPRDLFYWENLETLQTILETNACNPILYSRQNTKVLAGLLILQLRYGINDFKQIMSFFLKEGIQTHELARQQYTKMYCSKVLRKEKGKLLFTGEGEDILVQQIKRNNILVPFSIRAISTDWTIQVQEGTNTFDFHESAKQLGKISSKDVLKKGLPGNSITRNKQHYLVTSIDHQQKSVQVKRFFIEPKTRLESSIPANRLYDPIITAGVFPKKYSGRSQTILFGQLTITRKAKAIANANPERIVVKNTEQNHNHLFNWQELTEKESEELALVEQVEGISITPSISLQSMKKLNQKLILKLFGEILLLEAEIVLSIPANEFRLAFNDIQLAIYDKGEANGNAEYLYQNLEEVAAQGLRRLQDCPCERGCKHCYGEMLGLLPEGAKSCLIAVMRGIGEENNGKDLKDNLEEEKTIQENYQDEEIISLSDIHLTSEHCYEEEFYQAVSSLSKQADIIIINGDLLDKPSDAGKKAFERLQNLALKEGFWSKLVFIRSSSIHDANIEQAASALYLDYVLIETPAGEVLFVHGNKIGIDPGEVKISTAEQAAIEAKNKLIQIGRSWLPRVTKETHLVIGHLHERFYNERWRVYGLGHWTKKGSDYHQKCLMVIEPTKTHNVIRLKNYEKEKEENGGRDRI